MSSINYCGINTHKIITWAKRWINQISVVSFVPRLNDYSCLLKITNVLISKTYNLVVSIWQNSFVPCMNYGYCYNWSTFENCSLRHVYQIFLLFYKPQLFGKVDCSETRIVSGIKEYYFSFLSCDVYEIYPYW